LYRVLVPEPLDLARLNQQSRPEPLDLSYSDPYIADVTLKVAMLDIGAVTQHQYLMHHADLARFAFILNAHCRHFSMPMSNDATGFHCLHRAQRR
jgi:hypothetical protein